ncbi:MAG: hypothetical protein A3G33_01935 [Omnitrophica bacterium RIFCSPLOWO2_12_FULL_44_17]|uniref:Pseudouridine synthase n=1 Tax=Candidatus Danuiimicrobium aquiferis TaxID=1801832 RepID=A0A1G1KT41_9BACT|nr:MAG: hypothetical protein A3B72_04045 [Omnitrophica bacterium RIFCSPHIGHO2_02_FULL_45_28]OGW89079.1 MAG: hypothetical protein A3E74_05510 [Omnitrophica bacterium RIFCSPHIGHO2_12_FULL_44_12]OGW96098.1 MAG: hypothetical protein A3G33_01935 [Omnitrophica bacterium RIFCSPLOWO2_12_FULL_44_17]OGX02391.1 MAG: hypothetical protein A3J12_05610 [Omnitrophica bacterium RIFCSPLOWO2_02_FULL_44_11]
MRLQVFLSKCGISSRRSVLEEIEAGKVSINGDVVRIPSYPIFPEKDYVTYEGKPVRIETKVYYMFHKPKGVITTVEDTHGRETVLDFFKHVKERIFPVGRLDQDTTGLLILTNDGDLSYRLTHPKFNVKKIYEALLNKRIPQCDVIKLERGVELEDGKTAPCRIKFLGARGDQCIVEIVLHEGKKRQIRLMFESIGYKVLELHRKIYGPLGLKGLPPGKSRELLPEEVAKLESYSQGEVANPRSRHAQAKKEFHSRGWKPKGI